MQKLLQLSAVLSLASTYAVQPSIGEDLGPADLTPAEVKNFHQNIVVFEAYCGYSSVPRQKCPVAITPTRLVVGSSSIPLRNIVSVFEGVDDLTGGRFRHYASGLKRRGGGGGLMGIYYTTSKGNVGLAGLGFERWGCMQAFNISLAYVRSGGSIGFNDVSRNNECSPSDNLSFDLESNYR